MSPSRPAALTGAPAATELGGQLPSPPSERRAWLLAATIAAVGLATFLAVVTGLVGSRTESAPPAILAPAATPLPATASVAYAQPAGGIVAQPTSEEQRLDALRFSDMARRRIARSWVQGFYPLYATAQRVFGVNWLLLASIHMQESAFSTARGTYSGLNFAHCCGGPMQFNVTNGPTTTWDLVSDSYLYAPRPARYDHMTASHPSIYDDFDAIMAAAHLLAADGAARSLDGAAWDAAYDYYGHDTTGVLYADQVLARAIGWSQRGFCINCGVKARLVEAVDAAYGVPVRAELDAAALRAAARAAPKHRVQRRRARPARRRAGRSAAARRAARASAKRRPAPSTRRRHGR